MPDAQNSIKAPAICMLFGDLLATVAQGVRSSRAALSRHAAARGVGSVIGLQQKQATTAAATPDEVGGNCQLGELSVTKCIVHLRCCGNSLTQVRMVAASTDARSLKLQSLHATNVVCT
jgi:hypothetical protein